QRRAFRTVVASPGAIPPGRSRDSVARAATPIRTRGTSASCKPRRYSHCNCESAALNHEEPVSDSTRPTLHEILAALERLGERVSAASASRLDGFVSLSLRRACEELRRFIPGLDLPPDVEGARFMARAAHAALEDGNAREALSRALRGMALAPHHPGLFYLAASACFEFGAVEWAASRGGRGPPGACPATRCGPPRATAPPAATCRR